MKTIDAFNHITPVRFSEQTTGAPAGRSDPNNNPTNNLDVRLRTMDKCGVDIQVLSAVRVLETPERCTLLNNCLAEIAEKMPDRFAAVACLPLRNPEAALVELDRAVKELHLRGVVFGSNIGGKTLDSQEFLPLYRRIAELDVPILLHPQDRVWQESDSKYDLGGIFGWPYDTSLAMARLVFSGVMEMLPSLKVVVHHGGAMVSFFYQRIASFSVLPRNKVENNKNITRPPVEYFKRFYPDTVLNGNRGAMECAFSFFGASKIVYATDYPNGPAEGMEFTQQCMRSVKELECSESEKSMMLGGNAAQLFKL